MGLREWVRRWLGVDRDLLDLEKHIDRQLNITSDSMRNLDLKHTGMHDALSYRVDVVTAEFQKLRVKVDAGPEPVTSPIMCPNGHTGLVMAVALAKFDAKDPSKSEVVGGGFSCPKCGQTFYADREGRWLPAEAAAPPGESPPVKSSAEPRLRVRSRRGEDS